MKVHKYKIRVQFYPSHPHLGKTIDEIWIPSLKLYFNSEGGLFEDDKNSKCERIPPENEIIDIEYSFISLLLDCLKHKKIKDELKQKIFDK